MRRRLFTAASLLSLAVFLSTPILWAASGLRGQHWIYTYDAKSRSGFVTQHNLDLTFSNRGNSISLLSNAWPGWTYRQVTVPVWAISVVSAVLPAVWIVRRKRKDRLEREGLCPICGYDLRASPSRCPECGTVTSSSE